MDVCFGSGVDGRRNGHERKFGAKIPPPESGPQHIDVVQGRSNHDRPGAQPKGRAPHTQLSPGWGNSCVVDMNELGEWQLEVWA